MSEKPTSIARNLTQSFANSSVKELCISHGKLVALKKNTILFDEDTYMKHPYVYYLVDGICSISGVSIEGQEQTFLFMAPGEIIGHVPYIMAKGAHSILYSYRRPTVMTKTNCTVYKIHADHFIAHMKNNLEFSNYLNVLLAHNYSMVIAHLKQVQEDSSATIICRFLLQMALNTPEGPVVPKLFTYNEISKYFVIHEVTVSRIIGRFKQEGYLTRTSAGLLITKPDELQNIISASSDFKY